jgi:hypothetical protein
LSGEEVILDESSVPIPDPEPVPEQRSSFLSSIGSFLTKSVSGGSSSSQEAAFLIPDV